MFALGSPGGHIVPETTDTKRSGVWPRAESFFKQQIAYRNLRDYQAAARRRGYKIVEVTLVKRSALSDA